MGVTIIDIAKACGVSRGTVDRALNNKPRINDKTKEMVLATAKAMGYRPDLLARSLVKGRSMTLGVVVFDIKNRLFALLLNSIEAEARKRNYHINIMLQQEDPELEIQLINDLVDRRTDGIIICPVNKGQKFNKFIKELPVPVMVIGNMLSKNIPYIGIDECKAAQDATEMIIGKKYERIVFVCPPLERKREANNYSHEQRLKGFMMAVEKCKCIEYAIVDHWNYMPDIEQFAADAGKRTALFCSGDTFALDIMKHLRKKGKKVPRDIGIMGFDGIDTLEYVTPALSTIYYPVEAIGVRAVENLIDRIDGRQVEEHVLMEYQIISGESL